jgi:hypothetical protein
LAATLAVLRGGRAIGAAGTGRLGSHAANARGCLPMLVQMLIFVAPHQLALPAEGQRRLVARAM